MLVNVASSSVDNMDIVLFICVKFFKLDFIWSKLLFTQIRFT